MKQFGLALFFLFICSGFTNQQSPLLSVFVPMGHSLDCAERCKTCIDENTFNEVYKAYTSKLEVITRDFNDKKFEEELIKKANEKKKALTRTEAAHRLSDNGEIVEKELSDEEKIEKEVSKSEEMLDQEVQVAVEKVTKVEGESNTEKIKDIASRIRSRMVEKYRKEAAKRLNINYDTLKKDKSEENEKKMKNKMLRKSGLTASSKAAAEFTAKSRQQKDDPDSVYKVYFNICCESGSVFYAKAPSA